MTPLEHYREAERLLRNTEHAEYDATIRDLMALAQVHATLANCHMTAGVWSEDKP